MLVKIDINNCIRLCLKLMPSKVKGYQENSKSSYVVGVAMIER